MRIMCINEKHHQYGVAVGSALLFCNELLYTLAYLPVRFWQVSSIMKSSLCNFKCWIAQTSSPISWVHCYFTICTSRITTLWLIKIVKSQFNYLIFQQVFRCRLLYTKVTLPSIKIYIILFIIDDYILSTWPDFRTKVTFSTVINNYTKCSHLIRLQ